MTTGIVKWFNYKKGYGFISLSSQGASAENAEEVFVHFSAIAGEEGRFKTLNQNDEVEFEISDGEKGKEARNVVVTKAAPRKRNFRKKRSNPKGKKPKIQPEE